MNGTSVPPAARPSTDAAIAMPAPAPAGRTGAPVAAAAIASVTTAAPANCAAVIATGSRPLRNRDWATVAEAISTTEARTMPSPASVAPPDCPPVIIPTPASDTAKPAQAAGPATVRCHAKATIATMTGAAPASRAACVTLVRAIPAFCSTSEPPYPRAPEASTGRRNADRSARRPAGPRMARRSSTASSTAAARAKRMKASHPGVTQARAIFDSGTVVPQATPAAVRAMRAR